MKHRKVLVKPNGWLTLILLGHIVLGVAYGLVTPIFEAPDEDGHYLFVRYLQLHHTLPVQTLDRWGPRAHHPPLYHILGALLSGWVQVEGDADRIRMEINPKVWFRYDDPETDNKAMWVHYDAEERFPYQGQALVVHVVRLLSLVFSTLGVGLTYLAARQVWPTDKSLALLAAGLVAFNPMVLFMSGVVQNNTTMLASAGAVVLALSVFLKHPLAHWHAWLLGVLLGVGVLLQLSALSLAAPIALTLFYDTWRTRNWRTLLTGGVSVAVAFLALTGWWFVRNRILYGDWTGNSVVAAMWCCDPVRPLQTLYPFFSGALGRLGQGLMITFPWPIYAAAGILVAIALAGLLRLGWSQRRARVTETLPLWGLHVLTVLGVGGALVFYAASVAPGLPGRYLFPAYPSLAILLAAGFGAWLPARWRGWCAGLLVGLNVSVALYGLFGLLWPTYAIPRTPTAAELQTMTPLDAEIGGTARLLGYRLDKMQVRGGDVLTVSVYWLPESRTDVPYTVFVHLLSSEAGSLTQRDTYPGQGNWATTVWDVGRPFVDVYRLHIPADAPTVSAQIVIGLYDGQTGARLPVTGTEAGSAEDSWAQFGAIEVKP